MTLDEAREVLSRMNPKSTDRFTPEEREAITAVGTAYLLRLISREEAARLLGLTEYLPS